MCSYDVIAGAVKDYWKANYPQDVVAFFQQKYSWDDEWEKCEELVECHGSDDYENMTFLSDFCEGQTDVKDVVIVSLREVTAFYSLLHKKPQTNADRIRAMTDEELAIEETAKGGCPHDYETPDDLNTDCVRCWLDWLKQEVDNG